MRAWERSPRVSSGSTNRALMRGNTPHAKAVGNDSELLEPASPGLVMPHSGKGEREGHPSCFEGGCRRSASPKQTLEELCVCRVTLYCSPQALMVRLHPRHPITGRQACSNIYLKQTHLQTLLGSCFPIPSLHFF